MKGFGTVGMILGGTVIFIYESPFLREYLQSAITKEPPFVNLLPEIKKLSTVCISPFLLL
jgi:hypothetical protein